MWAAAPAVVQWLGEAGGEVQADLARDRGDHGRERGHETDAAPQHLAAVLVLAEALDLRDGDTASHARTVAVMRR